jgi:hypothetical protein
MKSEQCDITKIGKTGRQGLMQNSASVKVLPPTFGEIEAARGELRKELAKAKNQPRCEKREADVIFKEMEMRLNAKF